MPLRSTLTRCAIAVAGGALVALSATGTAVADDDWDPDRNNHDKHRFYQGQVIARGGLLLRSAPNRSRGSEVLRVAAFGEIVDIFCKTPGESVDGNPLWYLLADGTWAWGSARYIDNIGRAPHWC
jgi:Bacterial SH3 domain